MAPEDFSHQTLAENIEIMQTLQVKTKTVLGLMPRQHFPCFQKWGLATI